jgi:hypothetical protein
VRGKTQRVASTLELNLCRNTSNDHYGDAGVWFLSYFFEISSVYAIISVGISELKTQRFPSVAKHQQAQRYKKRSIIREVFVKKAYENRSNIVSQTKVKNKEPKNSEVFESGRLKTSL